MRFGCAYLNVRNLVISRFCRNNPNPYWLRYCCTKHQFVNQNNCQHAQNAAALLGFNKEIPILHSLFIISRWKCTNRALFAIKGTKYRDTWNKRIHSKFMALLYKQYIKIQKYFDFVIFVLEFKPSQFKIALYRLSKVKYQSKKRVKL